ncbi:MAG: DUF2336 domain-containing protein [Rhodospirillales bacterium]|nr:DUF2336 domain-containing protein [Rhodospirillales bacterium]
MGSGNETPLDRIRNGSAIGYDEAKALARHEDTEVRRALAGRQDIRPEILYFLAEDPDPVVRRAVARNDAAPRKADILLVEDHDTEVRTGLAAKIARLAPGLTKDEQDIVHRLTYEALDALARDQLAIVRQVVSETIRDAVDAPADIVRRLAWDIEVMVASPVLEFSPVLTDDDLMEIIGKQPVHGSVSAISRRANVSENVSDAIASTDNEEAIAALLANESAQIREETLDMLIEQAPKRETWHEPLVGRPVLPLGAAARLARFVSDRLVDILEKRKDLDDETKRSVQAEVKRRLDGKGPSGPVEKKTPEDDPDPYQKALEMHEKGLLNEAAVADAIEGDDPEWASAVLAAMAGLPVIPVKRILKSQSAKAIVSLAWKANLSMDAALTMQIDLAQLKHGDILQPANNNAFPLSEGDMNWQIELFED